MKMKKDERVNAPLISWKMYLLIFAVVYFLIVGQTLIVINLIDYTVTLAGMIIYYALSTGLIVALLFGFMKRYVYGKPLKRIGKAARQIASGNFQVRVEPIHQNGKKDETDVLIDDFNSMAEELGSIELLKNDFVANVSHEMKSPLGVIQSYARALNKEVITEKERQMYSKIIIDTSQKMSDMISNILKLNRLEKQKIYAIPHSFQLGEQLRQCALQFMPEWEKKNIKFSIDVIDIEVCYDKELLEILWNNLLSNAIKFTEQGGRIQLHSWIEQKDILVEIKDNGCGMTDETKSRIFEKFYQGDYSHATEGNGLGMALVSRVLEITEIKMQIESKLEYGTSFTLTFH